jgi:hypothetical protein
MAHILAYHVQHALSAVVCGGVTGAKGDGATRFLSECRAICPPTACGLEDVQRTDAYALSPEGFARDRLRLAEAFMPIKAYRALVAGGHIEMHNRLANAVRPVAGAIKQRLGKIASPPGFFGVERCDFHALVIAPHTRIAVDCSQDKPNWAVRVGLIGDQTKGSPLQRMLYRRVELVLLFIRQGEERVQGRVDRMEVAEHVLESRNIRNLRVANASVSTLL